MKKKRLSARWMHKIAGNRFFLAMKLNFFLMFFVVLSASANIDVMSQRVNLDFKNTDLSTVFKSLESQTGHIFVYSADRVQADQIQVSIQLKDTELKQALEVLFKDLPYKYSVEGQSVLIIPVPRQIPREIPPASQKTITGSITDETGAPLVGATVIVKGTTRGVATDVNGRYSIVVPADVTVLEISFLGYKKVEVQIGNRTEIDVKLEPDTQVMEDVVVTGYQTISKERATGAFDIIGQKFIDKPSSSIAQRLVGVVPGVAATQNADGDISFVIRGQGSLISNKDPLLVVDGFPIEGKFSSINPNDVESISILKDAAAASIWGARASNGVIVITTKKSKKNKGLNVEFSAQVKINSKTDIDYLRNSASSADMVEYEKSIFGKYSNPPMGSTTNESGFRSNYHKTYTQAGILYNQYATGEILEAEMNIGLNKLQTLDNKKQIEEYLLQRPIYQQYNLSLSGATDRMSNYVSLLYSHDIQRYNENKNNDIQFNYRGQMNIFKWLDFNLSTTIQYTDSDHSGISASDITSLSPYDMLVNPDGSYTNLNFLKLYTPMIDAMVPKENFPYSDWSYNPITEIKNRSLNTTNINLRFQGGLTFKIIEGLTLSTKFQYERLQTDNRNLYNDKTFYVRNMVNQASTWNMTTGEVTANLPSGSILTQAKTLVDSYNWRNQINFNRTIAKIHTINFVGGIELSQLRTKSYNYAPTYGYDDDHLTVGIFPNGTKGLKNWIGNSLNIEYINQFTYRTDRYFSAFANLAYTFNDRYSISGSFRIDASNFITDDPAYRYSPFWSVGTSWNMMNEEFMESIEVIDQLKPRITFGCNGNSDSSTSLIPLIGMNGYNQTTGELEAEISSKGNPTLRWERTNTLNFGIDYSFFCSKLYGKIDYYYKHGKDILADVAIPIVNGAESALINNAEITNHGIEFQIGSRLNITNDLIWDSNIVFSYNKNKVKKLLVTSMPYWWLSGEGAGQQYIEGKPINSLYSYIYGGMKNMGTADSPKILPVVNLIGDEYMPFDGSTNYDGLDFLKYQGTKVAPYDIGMTHTFSYKGIDLSFTFTGKFGHVFRRTGFNYPGRGNIPNAQLSEIIGADPNEVVPMPYQDTDNLSYWNKANYLSYLTTNAFSIRMQELTLSYSLPIKYIHSTGMNRLTFFLQGNNLFTIKSIDEDPEYRYGGFRLQPSYTLGIKVGF